MSEKVKLPREVAEAIELMRAKGCTSAEIVSRKIDRNLLPVTGMTTVLQLDTDTLIRALYIGYEVEETPEEKLLNYYLEIKRDSDQAKPHSQELMVAEFELQGIKKTLGILGIKIKGVNVWDF